MAEGNARSSIIRRHVAGSVGPAEPKDGEKMESWVLASDTNFGKPMHLSAHSYYGLPIDVGTPGFRAGGALPVELSQFCPERNKDTGAVVITWSTQSEAEQRWILHQAESATRWDSLKVINATMIPGAGTTSERQFYSYTRIQLLKRMSSTTTKLKMYLLMGIVRRLTQWHPPERAWWVLLVKRRCCGESWKRTN